MARFSGLVTLDRRYRCGGGLGGIERTGLQRLGDGSVAGPSLEYEEVRALADRILVIYEGRIAGEFPPDVTEETLGIVMTGGHAESDADPAVTA